MHRPLVIGGFTVLLVLLAVSVGAAFDAQRELGRAERERARAQTRENRLVRRVGDDEVDWWAFAGVLDSREPTAEAKVQGVYRARVIRVEEDGVIVFDWLGYSPDPHGADVTNRSGHHQALSPDVLSSIRLRRADGSTALERVDMKEAWRSMRAGDAPGKAMLGSDWWVAVSGRYYLGMLQAD
jgi:hypothetical protein